MKESLQKLCNDFIANRDAVRQAFKWDPNSIYPVCANVFCANDRIADSDQLKDCRRVIETGTGLFSSFRGNIKPILAAMLALEDDPEARMEQAKEYYGLLKQEFWGTEYLALVAFLLTSLAEKWQVEEKLFRGKEIYQRMKKEHPFLTSSEDSIFAVLLAFSPKSDDALIEDMETCYAALKPRFSIGNNVQTASQVLSMTDGESAGKAQRMIDLYDALREAGVKYGRNYELATLAALSLADADIAALAEEISEVSDFLKTQKGYGALGCSAQQRAMHAAMIVSDQYTPRQQVNTAAMASTLAMIVAQQIAMCTIAASTASTAASRN